MEVSGQLHVPAALPLGNSFRYQLGRGMPGPRGRSGRYEGEKNLVPAWNSPANKPVTRLYLSILLHDILNSLV
jgi:hypothetical protein